MHKAEGKKLKLHVHLFNIPPPKCAFNSITISHSLFHFLKKFLSVHCQFYAMLLSGYPFLPATIDGCIYKIYKITLQAGKLSNANKEERRRKKYTHKISTHNKIECNFDATKTTTTTATFIFGQSQREMYASRMQKFSSFSITFFSILLGIG